ncbi:Rhodanese- sulfurtransferase, partial [Spiromyces aspiralis]
GVNNDDQEPWLIELGGNDNPMEDQYSKRREEKKERVEKNKRRQQRNLEEATVAENKKSANPRDMRKQEIQKRLAQTKLSTASMGKFDAKLEGEPKLKSAKRKHTPNVGDTGEEKERAKRLLQQVNRADESSKNLVNIRKAQRNINNENAKKSKAQRSTNNENAKKNKARGKK